MALLQTQALSKSFGGIKAVNDCTFEIEEGSISALIGPNGAGKTTVFNLISGLLKPDSGTITYNGERIEGKQPHQVTRRGVSRTFQISRDLQEMTLLENLIVQSPTTSFGDLFKGSMLEHERDHAMELLDFVGITHLAEEKSKNLSYGQKKLMEFAATLMTEPRLVLLDEPAGGVNPALLEDIMERIQVLNKRGITFLIVEHNMDVVMNLCDPVIVMAYGTVLAEGAPQDIQNNEEVLEAYLGE
ncbi:MAG: ABC transporter ATP-binding protein [Anaerolineales bacterium]|jgi:branched-chain amino acid transport system ATP-binding protein